MRPILTAKHGKANGYAAKFTGYQYGGRPLGITFVKYLTPPGQGDAMDTAPSGITQDQIM